MGMERFFKLAKEKPKHLYRGPDAIPGTTKVRTYCGNSSLYSKESSLDRMEGKKNNQNHEHKVNTKL